VEPGVFRKPGTFLKLCGILRGARELWGEQAFVPVPAGAHEINLLQIN
jgi:hypothetical protein